MRTTSLFRGYQRAHGISRVSRALDRMEKRGEREREITELVSGIFIKGRREGGKGGGKKNKKDIRKAPGAAKCKVIYRRFQGEQIAFAASSYEFLEDAVG